MTQDGNSAGDSTIAKHAPTVWAQRNLVTYITFKVESCNNPKVTFETNKVVFAGDDHYTSDKYYNELEMFDEIKPEGCVWAKKGPGVECTLQKKNEGFWPRLVKDKTKIHWLKVDFNKWVDEDEADESPAAGGEDDYDLSQMMAQMGGAGGGIPDMDGLEQEEEDSDDEDLPDLEDAEENNEDGNQPTEIKA